MRGRSGAGRAGVDDDEVRRKVTRVERYVIERTLPGAGALTDDQIRAVATRSNEVLAELGDEIDWIESYVSDDKLYCVYDARDPELIREHAARGGFPCDSVQPVRRKISPADGS